MTRAGLSVRNDGTGVGDSEDTVSRQEGPDLPHQRLKKGSVCLGGSFALVRESLL